MNYYRIDLIDEPKTSWVMMEVLRHLPKHPKRPELPPVLYKFLPFPDAEVCLKPQYRHACCEACGCYETDEIFEIGFTEPVTIRLKGEFGYTSDKIFVIKEKVLEVLQKAEVAGYETKPIGKSGWHALRATLKVDCNGTAMTTAESKCSGCGRPTNAGGIFRFERQVSLPTQLKSFFTTKSSWPSARFTDRTLFITEDVLAALKAGKVKGPYCTRLATAEEAKLAEEKARQGDKWWQPPKSTVFLNGK
jgi:hypothetical protein